MGLRLEVDQQVDVAVGAEVMAQGRAEDGKLRNIESTEDVEKALDGTQIFRRQPRIRRARTSASEDPSSSLRKTISTGTRVPRITGLPVMTAGSISM